MAAVAGGDDAALAELLGRWQRPLFHFIDRQTGGRDVEDLHQETWLRAVRAADRFNPRRRFSTWLFQIALNLCRDWRRRAPPVSIGTVADDVPAPGDERTEARLDARRLLAALPDAQREVVILRYCHDLSEDDVAVILGCPPGTVKSRLHHAMATLKSLAGVES